ncbi:undecaprenyl-diphosphate phosphatase [Salipaludibacillus agaradhaerens]|jgi:undecaprenyl-diphosphatase|uniref:undecaprenyl-diphosphate phosphatase n=1 Tax=Salipaludibacillus agaradhaerens TaxID=76935 RepID=UPI002151CB26|nr:undecaprenyl-diphosphate phosphatase [Salipaludibacillus agaradhaerens]MCR6105263.1 undecaprenyl-diphosphate phosphatase [Salipaludibacillus agaradhaerens]MCR6117305.1 undecaprenyl-diphosphate phosphatase [Salipaludibacillus agaradhaerens]UJW56509.1 undecaprenyl-diphosphate phosphatase [Bacillus sp. A116_S68]
MTFSDIIQYIILGVIQGATEPLPVSSSGHLRIVSYFFGVDVPDLHLEVFLNGASLLAVFIVYKTDLLVMVRETLNHVRKPTEKTAASFKLSMLIIVGTIPAVLAGGLLRDFIGGEMTHIHYVAVALIITGIALWLIRHLKGYKKDGDITYTDAVIVGIAQAFALMPGISRSGATIVAALARKIEAETALKFSFFLSIPVSIGSLVLESSVIVERVLSNDVLILYLIAFFVSLLVSVFAIKLLINVVTRGKLLYFALYCFSVAIIVLVLA